ncbi:hypothetical protein [Endozoicomonas arenosclerae]|uniref:hypothetical protein n=1 Tax=Endozoicomonas arenosclerae TaxID=1633495 RepID=UPI000785A596|nr:hypothetical protein [Endozoicomonas arenosclerae]
MSVYKICMSTAADIGQRIRFENCVPFADREFNLTMDECHDSMCLLESGSNYVQEQVMEGFKTLESGCQEDKLLANVFKGKQTASVCQAVMKWKAHKLLKNQ